MPLHPIDTNPHTPSDFTEKSAWSTYAVSKHLAVLVAGFVVIGLMASVLPSRARAFWPFSIPADAAVNTLIPSASTPALVAPINENANASAPIALATTGDTALIANSGPTGLATDVQSVPASDQISVYVVRPGDTLSDIGLMFGVSINTIIWANNLSGPRDVHPGDTLIILPVSGIEHMVTKGDTLSTLATKYHSDATEIAQYNGLQRSAPLAVGTRVLIPGGELPVPQAPVRHSSGSGSGSTGSSSGIVIGGRVIFEPYLGGSGPIQNGYYTNPVPGGIITQGIHGWNAVDIGAPRGTPIHAAADGTVIISRANGAWNGGYGNYVVITHDNGSQTLYAHMTYGTVSAGQSVYAGQVIGYVGATGMATGPHLHFEVRGAANPFRNCNEGSVCSPQ